MRTLLVEDEKIAQQVACKCLSDLGCQEVDLATSIAAGLRLAREHHYDLAIIDLGLDEDPHASWPGLALIAQLREDDKQFPILIWSGRRDWHIRFKGKQAGADAYLMKSVENSELADQLSRLLTKPIRTGALD